jgi:signal peptidase II
VQERRAAPALRDRDPRANGALRRLLVTVGVAGVVVAADQLTKSWALSRLQHGTIHVIWKLDFQLAFNSGSAFSLAQGWAPVLGAFAALAVVVLLVLIRKAGSTYMAVAVGLIVGGALGNLADRVFRSHHGAVVDFIAFHFWPTFNLADSAIVVGTIWAALLLLRSERRAQDTAPPSPTEPPTQRGATRPESPA